MNFKSLILLFGVCLRWTVAELVNFTDYVAHVENKTLNSLTLTGSHQPSVIELSGVGIEYIEENVFDNFTYITLLDLTKNKIQNLSPRVFSRLINLTVISVANNYLSDISGRFNGLKKLELVNLSRNPLRRLNRGDLFGLTKSTTVLTIGNELEYLSSDVFQDPSVNSREFEKKYQTYHEYEDEPTGSAVPLPDAYEVKICKTDDGLMESVEQWEKNETLGNCSRANIQRILRSLDSASHSLKKFRRGWYKLPRFAINKIVLSNNNMDEIEPELLNDLPQSLTAIDLSFNFIKIIRRNVIENSYLRTLILNNNDIEIIEDSAFERTNLTTLRLKANLLTTLASVKTLPRSIEGLSVSSNLISDIPVDTFRNLDKLRMINFSINSLKKIESGTFENQKNLLELRLVYNNFTELNFESFKNMKKLKVLDFSYNKVEKIFQNTFSKFQNSEDLRIYLIGNKINSIEKGSFSNLNLFLLDLSSNRINDQSIAKGAFNGCGLQKLSLSHNSLTRINSELFRDIWGSYVLNLDYNHISSIKPGDAKYLSNVRILNLNYNPLKDLYSGALFGLSKDKDVGITLKGTPIELIHGGLFDDGLRHSTYYDIV